MATDQLPVALKLIDGIFAAEYKGHWFEPRMSRRSKRLALLLIRWSVIPSIQVDTRSSENWKKSGAKSW